MWVLKKEIRIKALRGLCIIPPCKTKHKTISRYCSNRDQMFIKIIVKIVNEINFLDNFILFVRPKETNGLHISRVFE